MHSNLKINNKNDSIKLSFFFFFNEMGGGFNRKFNSILLTLVFPCSKGMRYNNKKMSYPNF